MSCSAACRSAGSASPFTIFGLFALAIVIGVAAWWALERTRSGKLLRAVIHDREISTAMGINVARMFTATFVIGAMLGALGGAITAPAISVVPGIGVDVIVLAFAVSVIGGLGSVAGAAIGALDGWACRAPAPSISCPRSSCS